MDRFRKRSTVRRGVLVYLTFAFLMALSTVPLAAVSSSVSPPGPAIVASAEENTEENMEVILLPGVFQAEDYRPGGAGIGYYDTTQVNLGGAYRSDGVDIQASWNNEGGYHVAWIDAGEWLAYDVEFQASGQYEFVMRVATTHDCRTRHGFRIELDGVDISGFLAVPNTGGWQDWEQVISRSVSVETGVYLLRIVAETGGFNLDSVEVREARPEQAETIRLPGRFEAQDFRAGGEGVGFHDTTADNFCGALRSDGVDIGICANGRLPCYYVGWVRDGEWLAFDVEFLNSSSYVFVVRTATIHDDRQFRIELDEVQVGSSISVPNTGDWHTWIESLSDAVDIPAGSYTLKIVAESRSFNLNDIEVRPSARGLADSLAAERWRHVALNGWR